jgi:hypothetical protein
VQSIPNSSLRFFLILALCLFAPLACAPTPPPDGTVHFKVWHSPDATTGETHTTVRCWGGTPSQNRLVCDEVKRALGDVGKDHEHESAR